MGSFGKWTLRLLGVIILALWAFLSFAPGIVESNRNTITATGPLIPVSPAARALHDDLVIGDWHADSLLWDRDLMEYGNRGHVDIPRLLEGNLALQVFTAVTSVPSGAGHGGNAADTPDSVTQLAMLQLWPPRTWSSLTERALYQSRRLYRFAELSGGLLTVITSRSQLDILMTARDADVDIMGGMLGIEGLHALDGNLANLDRLEAAGFRVMGLHHFFDNDLGTSLHGEAAGGLSDFGRTVVEDLVARNMVIDLAHSSEQVARDVVEMTDIPLIVSHTGLRSHCDTHRNFPDDLMQAIVNNGADQGGGVIGMGYWAEVTCDATPDGVAAAIMAAIDVLGEDHVSLGSDFDGSVAVGFDASQLVHLTDALLRAGATEPQIRLVMGENLMRVLRARLN